MIRFLDLYGLIAARIVSPGGYGKTPGEIMSSLPERVINGLYESCSWERLDSDRFQSATQVSDGYPVDSRPTPLM